MDIDGALSLIRAIPDYPKPGILFQDISPMLADGPAFDAIIAALARLDSHSDVVAGIEARGFILGSALAQKQRLASFPFVKRENFQPPPLHVLTDLNMEVMRLRFIKMPFYLERL